MPSWLPPSLPRQTFTEPTTAASVPAARRRIGTALTRFGLNLDQPIVDTALLIATELVTNSVIHAAEHSPHVDISIYIRAGHLVIAVHDRRPHCPRALPVSRPNGGGWGLKLVTDLTAQYGGNVQMPEDPDGGGKTVQVTLPISESARLLGHRPD